ncbi:CKLF-like MARVEL transmembrane domain-containing protein 7 isoform X2 [Mytilus californianus]|uniref:CKLF-like MARVEL transmembrane domain-containing protein 7 isoform X2 n=1 Tax=Mytilus californianus TaxID=6549 RepID=UPI00224810CA|nr:CKLF-like MARVEL transmembrane domain-containing protein 7 isoform X2 [Mytilus californianus]
MDSQYNVESTEKTTTTTSSSGDVGLDKIYMKSIDSILKIAEMVLSLIVFICVTSHPGYSYIGGGWVQFVSISCLITVLILWIFFMLRIIYKLPGPWMLIILIYFVVYVIFYFITAIVCFAQSGKIEQSAGLVAAGVFCVLILVVLGADTFFQFRKWQDSGSSFSTRSTTTSSGGATATTTTHTTYETRTQY